MAGTAKLEEVTKLMELLSADLQKPTLLQDQRDAHLEQLKVFGRDPTNADPIFTKEGIEVLTRHAFDSPSRSTSRNALRCLANALLLKPETRKIFVDLGYESKACNLLKSDDRDDEFLVSRVIFLTTYAANIDIEKMIDHYHLAEAICTNIARHATQYTSQKEKAKELNLMEDMALIESLKLLFNITHFCPQRNVNFTPALSHILVLLTKKPISTTKPLDASIGPLINSLINIPIENESLALLFPELHPDIYTDRLVDILEKASKAYRDEELEQTVSPLIALVRRVYELAPSGPQKHLQELILPSSEDRQLPLGKGDSLSARLLRLSLSPTTPQVRDSISSLLFELSDKDAQTFVQNVGYGFASGFLFKHNMAVPENALEAWSASENGASQMKPNQDSSNEPRRVNPITGQLLDKEPKIQEPEMTEDEKEREAERLFVLFERLKKTGVINVENPVTKAFQEGRFQELDDDDENVD